MVQLAKNREELELPLPEGEPSRLGWLIGLLALASGAFLIFAMHHFSQGLSAALLLKELREELQTIALTEEIFRHESFSQILDPRNRRIRVVVDLISATERGESARALELLDAIEESTGDDRTPLRNALLLLQSITDKLQEATQTVKREEDGIDLIATDWGMLERRLRTTLRITQPTTESGDPREQNSYQSGFLAGLPAIPEIPDGIESDTVLVKLLNGVVEIFPGGKLPEREKGELLALRAEAAQLGKRSADQEERLLNAEGALTALEGGRNSAREHAIHLARQELIALARPDLSPVTKKVYSNASRIMKGFGIVLPPM